MTDPNANLNANLNAKYLDGDADAEEVQRLEQALAGNPDAADELMADAFMEVHLRELLCGSELGASIAEESLQPSPVAPAASIAGRVFSKRWLVAAMLIATVTGWTVALYVTQKLSDADTQIDQLTGRITELESAGKKPSIPITQDDAPQIHSTRGWLMALPPNNDADGKTLFVGTAAPLDQRLWTCPWGAAEFRYDSGVSISIERNTTVKLSETDDLRQLTLERGIVHVTNLSDSDTRPTEIKCALAKVRLINGQVAVQVNGQHTAIEAAVNQVEVFVEEDGVTRPITVRRGHYLIVKPGEKAKVIQGMLQLGLEPPGK